MKSIYLFFCLFSAVLLLFCQKDNSVEPESSNTTPIYVTVAGHIEDGEYYAVCEKYPEFRQKLLDFADLIKSYGIPFNLQIDYEFFVGANNCETPDMMVKTANTNVIDYLAKHYDFEIDPHKGGGFEEGQDNYADVRYVGGQVTSLITETAGGIVWNEQAQYERFDSGESGWQYPDFTWYPKILSLGVHFDHHNSDFSNDDLTSGIWKPKGFDDEFLIHDESARMIYVGPGMSCTDWFGNRKNEYPPMDTSADYVELMVNYLEQKKIPEDKMYTVTLSVPQSVIFDKAEHYKLTAQFDQLESLVKKNKVIYVTYTEVVRLWQEKYDSEPNIFTFDQIDDSDY